MLHRRAGRTARPTPTRRLTLETLESRDVPSAFTAGNLVIYRVGDGSAGLSNVATAVFLDEYTPTGTLVQSIAVATSDSGSNQTLTASGTATSEGALSLSADGRFLVFTGYDAALGTTGVASTATSAVVRTIGLAGASGTIDTSTTTTQFSGNNIRGATSTNGTDLWAVGGANGVIYTTTGSNGAGTVVSTTLTNMRGINVFNNQLYVSTGSGSAVRVGTVGTGTPTTTNQTITNLPSFITSGSPYAFYFVDLTETVAGLDTLYIASDDAIALRKYSLVDGAWTSNGTVGTASDAYRGLTASVTNGVVTVYATRKGGSAAAGGGELVSLTDSSGYNGTFSGTPTVIATAGTNTTFRGVAFTPNAPPVVTLNGGDVSYTENDAATVLASAATVTDATSPNFDTGKLTVAFGANGTADDRLAIRNQGTDSGQIGVSGSNVTFGGTTIGTFTGGTGTTPLVVTFNANATPAAAQALVRNITFANVSENPSTANRTVNFTLTDGDGGTSETASRTVTVTAVNDAPVVATSGGTTSYTENGSGVPVDGALTVSDVDSANLTGATVAITGNFASSEDALAFTNQNGITGSYNSATGVLTLSGSASTANYQTALRSVKYSNSGDNPSALTRTVTFAVSDGATDSAGATKDVTVTAVNDAPVVTAPATASTNEDAALTFSSANGTAITVGDVDAGTSSVTVTLTASNGTLTLGSTTDLSVSGNGTASVTLTGTLTAVNTGLSGLVFTPTANFNGPASLQVQASDNGNTGTGGARSDTKTVTITVNAVNDAPAGTEGSATIAEDDTYTFAAADFGFTDPSDAPAHEFAGVVLTTLPTAGTLTLDGTAVSAGQFVSAADIGNGLLAFAPAPDANGPAYASFTFQVRDTGGTANGGQNTDPSANTFTFNVTAVNDAPVVTAPTAASTDEDTGLAFSSANGNAITVSDADATELTVALTATNGTLALGSTTNLTVTGNGTATVTLSGTASAINAGLSGLTFTPTANFNGPASVTVSATDSGGTGTGGALSDSKTVTVTVNSVNDAPLGANFTVTTNEDVPYTFATSDFSFADPNDTPASAFAGVVIGALPAKGALTNNGTAVASGQFVSAGDIAAGRFVFVPADDANGPAYASFTFRVRDTDGGTDTDLAARTATINVTAVNDDPSVTLSQATITTTAGTAFARDGFATFAAGGGADEVAQTAQSYKVAATNGALFAVAPTIDANGRLTFTASGTTGTTTVTVTVTDSAGATSAEVQFGVTVESLPVPPSPMVPVNIAFDPTARFIAAGADAGSGGTVALFDARTGTQLVSFQPFGNYTGGVAVALGDVTGDGTAELIVATRGSVGSLAVYDLATGATLVPPVRPFAGLNTGLQITTADVDGDGVHDLVFSPERGAPLVAGFSFVKGQFVSFANPLPGANLNFQLAAGNVTGDGRAELILSANGFVAVLDPSGAALSTFAVAPGFAGEMALAVGDTDGDGQREIVLALQAPGADTAVGAFTAEGALVWSLFADTGAGMRRDGTNRPAIQIAPRLAVADVTGDRIADILLGSQPGLGTSRVTVFDGATHRQVRADVAFGDTLGLFTDAG